jgi:hypothetical protein
MNPKLLENSVKSQHGTSIRLPGKILLFAHGTSNPSGDFLNLHNISVMVLFSREHPIKVRERDSLRQAKHRNLDHLNTETVALLPE